MANEINRPKTGPLPLDRFSRYRQESSGERRTRDLGQILIQTAQVIVVVLDPLGKIVLINPYLEKISGYRLSDVLGKDWLETFIPGHIHSLVRSYFVQTPETVQAMGKVIPICTLKGESIQVEWWDRAIVDENGKSLGILAIGQDITARLAAEQALRQSEARYRLIFNSTNDVMLIHEVSERGIPGLVVDMNDAGCSLLGYSYEEVRRLRVPDFSAPIWEGEGNIGENLLLYGELRFETIFLAQDGRQYPFEIFSRLIHIEDRPLVLAVGRNISERRQNEQALRESEARSNALLQAIPDRMIVVASDGLVLDCHCQVNDVSGIVALRRLLLGKYISEVFSEKVTDGIMQAIALTLKTGVIQEFEVCLELDSDKADVEARLVPYGEDRVLMILRDINQRKKTEAELIRISAAMQMTNDSVIITDMQGRIEQANKAAIFLCDVPDGENLQGRFLFDLIWGEGGEPVDKWEQMLPPSSSIQHKDYLLETIPGKKVPVEVSISRMVNPVGELIGYVTILRDITQRKETEQRLRFISSYDALTGLHNRFAFDQQIKRFEKDCPYPVGVIMIDVDDLKGVNDRFGHAVGDELLIRVADLLKSTFRDNDFISRFGGDEFVVFMPYAPESAVIAAQERLVKKLVRENTNPSEYQISFSIGCSSADENTNLQQALFLADEQMYHQKRKKKS